MQRLSTTLLGLGVLGALSCGAPAELDESQFPGLNETGYTDVGTGTAGANGAAPLGGVGGATGTVGAAGSTAAPPVGNGGAGMAPVASGGAPPAGGAPATGGGGTRPAGGGTPTAGGCPDDITLLFNRPIEQGGCAGAACHIPGATRPDLISPNPEQRLRGMSSSCNGIPFIGDGTDDSMIALKITTPPSGCGVAMPFFMPQALSAEDEACILDWIDKVGGG
jgi:hypothetical protein